MPAAIDGGNLPAHWEALHVGIDIGVRVLQRVAHAGLGGEMDDVGEFLRGKQRGGGIAVRQVELDEAEAGLAVELFRAVPF